MQRTVNTAIEEEVFSMWLAYNHGWAKDVFSTDPPHDYITGTKQNQMSRTTRTIMEPLLGSQGRRVRLKIDCELM
jgi:hypothetical protein